MVGLLYRAPTRNSAGGWEAPQCPGMLLFFHCQNGIASARPFLLRNLYTLDDRNLSCLFLLFGIFVIVICLYSAMHCQDIRRVGLVNNFLTVFSSIHQKERKEVSGNKVDLHESPFFVGACLTTQVATDISGPCSGLIQTVSKCELNISVLRQFIG